MDISLEKPANAAQWLRIYRLYRRAFPKYERKPFSLILSMYRKGKTDVWYCKNGGAFSGIAITINSDELVLLDYFAVESTQRGSGVGSAILQKLRDRYKSLFLEIESVCDEAENLPERIRRRQFYLSNGMESMDVMVVLFGTKMELLGFDCKLDFAEYRNFYRTNLGPWAAEHINKA